MKKTFFVILISLLSKSYVLAKLATDTVLIDLDKSTTAKIIVIDSSNYNALILNIFFNIQDKSLLSHKDNRMLTAIYLMPQLGEKTISLHKVEKIKSNTKSIEFIKERFIYEYNNYYSNCKKISSSIHFKETNIEYIIKYKNSYYISKGEFLTEYYLLSNRGTLFPNENDYITIDTTAKIFTETDLQVLVKAIPNFHFEENFLNRTFLEKLPTNKDAYYTYWVGPLSFERDYILIKRNGKWYSAGWYDESDYRFLFIPSIGIVGREFKKFYKEPAFLKYNSKSSIDAYVKEK